MLAEIEVHPKIREWDTDVHTENLEEMYQIFKKFFDELPKNKDQSFLVAKCCERLVGFVGIHRRGGLMSHIGEIGISVHPDYQRRGIGTKLLMTAVELTRKEGFERLEADTLENNKPMIKIAGKVGFRLEGVRKMRIKKNGKYLNEALLAVTLRSKRDKYSKQYVS
jgi:putative acetyltransferase